MKRQLISWVGFVRKHWLWWAKFIAPLCAAICLFLWADPYPNALASEAAPAWVQAVGSVLAIVFSVLIAHRQAADQQAIANRQAAEQRSRQEQSDRAVAVIAVASLVDAISTLQVAMKTIIALTECSPQPSQYYKGGLDELNAARYPTREHLLDLAPVIPAGAVAYVRAFHMRTMLIRLIQAQLASHPVPGGVGDGIRQAMRSFAIEGEKQCAIVINEFLPLAIDHRPIAEIVVAPGLRL